MVFCTKGNYYPEIDLDLEVNGELVKVILLNVGVYLDWTKNMNIT